MISEKEVEYVAKLARIGLTQREKEKFSKDLNRILDYFNKLKEVDTSGIEPLAQVSGPISVFRRDEKPDDVDAERIKGLIGQAPQRENNIIKTKPILEK